MQDLQLIQLPKTVFFGTLSLYIKEYDVIHNKRKDFCFNLDYKYSFCFG